MKFALKLEGDTLSFMVTGVEDTPDARGRVCRIEIALLKTYVEHRSLPVLKTDAGLIFRFLRKRSDWETYEAARRVLRGFCIEV